MEEEANDRAAGAAGATAPTSDRTMKIRRRDRSAPAADGDLLVIDEEVEADGGRMLRGHPSP